MSKLNSNFDGSFGHNISHIYTALQMYYIVTESEITDVGMFLSFMRINGDLLYNINNQMANISAENN